LKEQGEKYLDDDIPEIDIWKWLLVIPWWRISFEYKRHMIDLKQKKVNEEKLVLKTDERK
jgi:hypothetical protein